MRSTPSVMMNYACAHIHILVLEKSTALFFIYKGLHIHRAPGHLYIILCSAHHAYAQTLYNEDTTARWIELCYAFAAVAHQESNANEFVLASRMLIALAQSIIIIISPSESVSNAPRALTSAPPHRALSPNMESNAAVRKCSMHAARGDMLAIL